MIESIQGDDEMNDNYSITERSILALNLKLLRKLYDVSTNDIAKVLFKSQSAIKKIETGKANISKEDADSIAKYFNISIDDLFDINLIDHINIPLEKKGFFIKWFSGNFCARTELLYPPCRFQLYNKDMKIISLFDFLVYFPLMDLKTLCSTVLRIQGDIPDREYYVFDLMEFLYNSISNKDARQYAEFLASTNTQKTIKRSVNVQVDNGVQLFIDGGLEYFSNRLSKYYFKDYDEYKRCKKEYYKELDNFSRKYIDSPCDICYKEDMMRIINEFMSKNQ